MTFKVRGHLNSCHSHSPKPRAHYTLATPSSLLPRRSTLIIWCYFLLQMVSGPPYDTTLLIVARFTVILEVSRLILVTVVKLPLPFWCLHCNSHCLVFLYLLCFLDNLVSPEEMRDETHMIAKVVLQDSDSWQKSYAKPASMLGLRSFAPQLGVQGLVWVLSETLQASLQQLLFYYYGFHWPCYTVFRK